MDVKSDGNPRVYSWTIEGMNTNWSGLFQKKNWDFLLPAILQYFLPEGSICCFLEKAGCVDTSFIQKKHQLGRQDSLYQHLES